MLPSFFRRAKKENKALLEHKLYLAKETPEPIFDLSDCDISTVPAGIYSLCKVFRKEVLNLSGNCLHSLSGGGKLLDLSNLTILNISDNVFSALPVEIQLLTSLRKFYIENNQLKTLPSTLCTLIHLEVLHVNNNCLVELPEELGRLVSLRSLHIQGNPKLQILPKTLHKANKLNDLQLSADVFVYPPAEIVEAGVEEILKFLCIENGCDCFSSKVQEQPESYISSSMDEVLLENALLEAKMQDLAKRKEQKNRDFLEIEKQWEEIRQKELEAATSQKVNKEKLLADIINQQEQLNYSLDKIQRIKDAERFHLVEKLRESEEITSIAVQKLLECNLKPDKQLLEMEYKEQELLLEMASQCKDVRKAQILEDMQELLQLETEKFKQLDETRISSNRSIVELEALSNSGILEVLQAQNDRNKMLAEELRRDDDLQKLAVASLLEKTDFRSWSLVQQVVLVEAQLAALTNIELNRRKLDVDHSLNDLAQQRVELSMMLMDLVQQQNERRAQLLSTLQSLEAKNLEKAEDFWIHQYQTLMDRMPSGLAEMQKNVDPVLVEILLMEGLLNYLPFLAKCHQEADALTEDDLADLGINNAFDRKRLLSALKTYKKNLECADKLSKLKAVAPTAPEMDVAEASAPELPKDTQHNIGVAEAECVICMDEKCQVIYIPCGHYCCCFNCSTTISDCPMCRGKIERIIPVEQ